MNRLETQTHTVKLLNSLKTHHISSEIYFRFLVVSFNDFYTYNRTVIVKALIKTTLRRGIIVPAEKSAMSISDSSLTSPFSDIEPPDLQLSHWKLFFRVKIEICRFENFRSAARYHFRQKLHWIEGPPETLGPEAAPKKTKQKFKLLNQSFSSCNIYPAYFYFLEV